MSATTHPRTTTAPPAERIDPTVIDLERALVVEPEDAADDCDLWHLLITENLALCGLDLSVRSDLVDIGESTHDEGLGEFLVLFCARCNRIRNVAEGISGDWGRK